ncbi:hypothetical protein IWW36_000695 [Coemansia brasiliensis]|uniref:Derlin n=1 Tax=Coemansia brasiliensis TaxID=2650707 RepID=A0A9W8M2P1_9FUNG|nr:hypothetical protein IWW36_000695 [Coemansia brasiliensis]
MARQAPPTRGIRSDGAQIAQWFNSLPVCTRFLLEGTSILTLVCGLQLLYAYNMALLWVPITKQFQIWRLVTTFLVTEFSLNGLIHLILLHRYSLALEKEEFGGRTADYAWFLMVCMCSMVAASWLTQTVLLSDGLLLAVVTLWSLHRANQIVKFFFGITFPARYLPYVTMFFDLLRYRGVFPFASLYGWLSAQAYYYLSVDLPAQGGLNYIPTPQFVYRLFGQVQRSDPRSTSAQMATLRNPISERPGGGHFWGQGRRLAR